MESKPHSVPQPYLVRLSPLLHDYTFHAEIVTATPSGIPYSLSLSVSYAGQHSLVILSATQTQRRYLWRRYTASVVSTTWFFSFTRGPAFCFSLPHQYSIIRQRSRMFLLVMTNGSIEVQGRRCGHRWGRRRGDYSGYRLRVDGPH
jgi:hypothetical protein